MWRFNKVTLVVLLPSLIALFGCEHLASIDKPSLLFPGLHRSEVLGILAGFGTTVASMPDLIAMLKRRSSAGMNRGSYQHRRVPLLPESVVKT
jgi:hypothetical protein